VRFVDGHWQETASLEKDPKTCPQAPNGKATEEKTGSWSFEPQPDGTLRGIDTNTAITNECGNQGDVWRTPIVATRVGDFPPAVSVADPALFLAAPAPAPTTGPR
jgi:serine/threonine protein kinase, bacterial